MRMPATVCNSLHQVHSNISVNTAIIAMENMMFRITYIDVSNWSVVSGEQSCIILSLVAKKFKRVGHINT